MQIQMDGYRVNQDLAKLGSVLTPINRTFRRVPVHFFTFLAQSVMTKA
jgi:hypothetical protein